MIAVIAAGTMLGLCAISFTIPSSDMPPTSTGGGLRDLVDPLRELLTGPAFGAVLLFVLTFKLGDISLIPMTKPFWVDRGFSAESIGAASTVGIVAAIAGALTGGALTTRWGIFTALWSLGLVQALSNLGYWTATHMPADQSVLETTIGYEQVAIELTAYLARTEPDEYVKQAFDFGLLEDFDHLYRYAQLLDPDGNPIDLYAAL